jgi:hypothetical protein
LGFQCIIIKQQKRARHYVTFSCGYYHPFSRVVNVVLLAGKNYISKLKDFKWWPAKLIS